jgi:uroporphyrinogen-III decarboxylase
MNSRERWLACMRFEPVDHVPDFEFGYWDETFPLWHEQGMPKYVDCNWKADHFFGLETYHYVPVNGGLIPGFQYEVIEEDDRHIIVIDWDGVKKMVPKDGASSIPRFIKFPIETREDWIDFKKRLDVNNPSRYLDAAKHAEWIKSMEDRDKPLLIDGGSLLGWIRNWMGFENVAIACMDDPEWVEEMIDYMGEFLSVMMDRALEGISPEASSIWEDIAFNHGPIISPKLFSQWMTPRYKKMTDVLKKHGCEFAFVDCDGNINSIVHCWLEGGVNIMFPLEIRGGTDPYGMREKFGHEVRLMGGVDKTQLIAGKNAIDAEIKRITPLVQQGGYIPHVDHRCPPDVTYENYLYYLKKKREAFGIPEPAPWKERREQYDWAKE